MKQIPFELMGDDLKKAKNEVDILRCLNHPNIIQYLDSYTLDRKFIIVMEYAEHGTLHDCIAKLGTTNAYLEPQAVMDFFCQIVLGLHHIHNRGIIHRDLKCENIFITGINANVIKIGDFGISKLLSKNCFTNTVIGTCNYAAPEICDGKPYNTKSDIWALGCILFEMCQLEKLFDGTVSNVVLSIAGGKIRPINTRIYGKQMQELLYLLLKPDPTQRPDTLMIMTLGDVFPSLYCLSLNLGCIF
ncbi:serine/threonine-protein kinase Nek8 [Dendroctonus ponderosae]|uniref:non-specific serine/threonine protein kinase n=2 Tax=Dendroctonus ponderosae TaxID=77166 RepID=A0AAR5QDI9_DENPD|nr:serine/threonine-protein kinase Nek8 [Dendroctonus ponderosae]KAH1007883.1 hypothetical protein HUJ04_005063 [Dendroctonus ponderosae]KAH1007884.1 hypothetical protein HUJ04_005063 [Dendroctonus ponderosae]KAH1015389.1 hypothetical protein HUJ05_013121 [Dendroctonus ponderosae]